MHRSHRAVGEAKSHKKADTGEKRGVIERYAQRGLYGSDKGKILPSKGIKGHFVGKLSLEWWLNRHMGIAGNRKHRWREQCVQRLRGEYALSVHIGYLVLCIDFAPT